MKFNVNSGYKWRALLSGITLMLLSTSVVGKSYAIEDAVLKIHMGGLFAEPTYELSTGEIGKLNDGMGFSSKFRKVLALHPDALKEAEYANSSRSTSFAGSMIMLVGTIVMLQDTLGQSSDVSYTPNYSKSLGLVLAGAIISTIGSRSFNNHLYNAVDIFNRDEIKNPMLKTDRHQSHRSVISPHLQAGLSMELNIGNTTPKIKNTPDLKKGIALIATLTYRF